MSAPAANADSSRLRLRPRSAVRAAGLAAAGLALLLAGCSKPARKPQVFELAQTQGAVNPPVVISGSPRRDTAAYLDSDDELTESDWAILEQLGPRPVWEQLNAKRKRSRRAEVDVPAAAPPRQTLSGLPVHTVLTAGRDATADRKATGAAAPDGASQLVGTDAATAGTVASELALPLEVTELPDGKVRMIWVLRSYGGAGIKTSRDPNTSRRTVELKDADLAPLIAALTPHLGPGGSVVPLARENTLIITCTQAARPSVVDLLARIDAPQRQVEISAKIFEVSHDFDFQQGSELLLNRLASSGSQQAASTFSAKRFLDALNAPAAAGAPVQGSVLKLMQTFSGAGISVDAAFQLLAEAGLIRVVSAPRMTVSVGQTGYMLAGQEMPIQSANIVNNTLQTITSYKPVGVQLYITPQSASHDRVKLHTISIVSSVSGFAPLPTLDGSRTPRLLLNPIIDSREAETAVTIRDGDTLVISGLRMVRTTTRENKIPGLGDLPIVSPLFKNHRSQQQLTDLYFFLTPTILESPAAEPVPAVDTAAQPTMVGVPTE